MDSQPIITPIEDTLLGSQALDQVPSSDQNQPEGRVRMMPADQMLDLEKAQDRCMFETIVNPDFNKTLRMWVKLVTERSSSPDIVKENEVLDQIAMRYEIFVSFLFATFGASGKVPYATITDIRVLEDYLSTHRKVNLLTWGTLSLMGNYAQADAKRAILGARTIDRLPEDKEYYATAAEIDILLEKLSPRINRYRAEEKATDCTDPHYSPTQLTFENQQSIGLALECLFPSFTSMDEDWEVREREVRKLMPALVEPNQLDERIQNMLASEFNLSLQERLRAWIFTNACASREGDEQEGQSRAEQANELWNHVFPLREKQDPFLKLYRIMLSNIGKNASVGVQDSANLVAKGYYLETKYFSAW